MKKLLPILLLLLGAGGGVGAGYFLRPPPPEPTPTPACTGPAGACPPEGGSPAAAPPGDANAHATPSEAPPPAAPAAAQPSAHSAAAPAVGTPGGPEYVALRRQMIVPIVSQDKVASLVVLSLSIEVKGGFSKEVYDREPALRDAFLQALFRHANTGGFNGDFTSGEKMADLRRALNSAAAQVLGSTMIQVLVTDILRQST